jgi:hypothetical protein
MQTEWDDSSLVKGEYDVFTLRTKVHVNVHYRKKS